MASSAPDPPATWWVYLIRCGDGSLYCGIARDTDARFELHVSGKGARYTRGRGPLELCARARCPSHGDALRIERTIKALPRSSKLKLVETRTALAHFVRRHHFRRLDDVSTK